MDEVSVYWSHLETHEIGSSYLWNNSCGAYPSVDGSDVKIYVDTLIFFVRGSNGLRYPFKSDSIDLSKGARVVLEEIGTGFIVFRIDESVQFVYETNHGITEEMLNNIHEYFKPLKNLGRFELVTLADKFQFELVIQKRTIEDAFTDWIHHAVEPYQGSYNGAQNDEWDCKNIIGFIWSEQLGRFVESFRSSFKLELVGNNLTEYRFMYLGIDLMSFCTDLKSNNGSGGSALGRLAGR